jgi:hypothetical protein
MKLLTKSNTKTLKGEKRGYITYILHLAPADQSGHEVCKGRSKKCTEFCLDKAGRGRFQMVTNARVRKTKWFFENRLTFMAQLVKDISAAIRHAQKRKLRLVIRLNGTSDIPWELIDCGCYVNIMERYPRVQFMDYTKLINRTSLPKNYHLTFSASETNHAHVKTAIARGMNVAVVFEQLPDTYLGLPVLDGDADDLRFLDPRNHIVGLLPKGPAKYRASEARGFVKKIKSPLPFFLQTGTSNSMYSTSSTN